MKHLTSADFATAISQGIVVVDFFATRCGPCRMLAPYLEQMAEQYKGNVTFYKVDVDQEQWLAMQQQITAMPTMQIFKDGKMTHSIRGANVPMLQEALETLMKPQ